MKPRMTKVCIWCLFLFLAMVVLAPEGRADVDRPAGLGRFDSLKARLIADGFDETVIEGLYRCPEANFLRQTVRQYITHKEKKLHYDRFLSSRFVRMGRQYAKGHRDVLERTYQEYGVHPHLIVALLAVESCFGTYTGKYPVFNVLSSLAVTTATDVLPDTALEVPDEVSRRLERRANWAYGELKAFLTCVLAADADPFSIKGSFAGAFGIPQFVPSSLIRFGRDGDGDGVVDLYNHDDAIASVANYLSAHGWDDGNSIRMKKRVLLRYNASSLYVETILRLSEKLGES